MARNVEIKARVADLDALRVRVEALSDGPAEVLEQRDVFFHVPKGRLKLRCFPDGRAELISYARSDATGPALSDYHIYRTGNPAGLESFLCDAFGLRGVVTKRRLLYLIGQTRVHLDEVEGLGSYMELEVVLEDKQTLEEGAQIADRVLEDLEMSEAERVACAYIDLLEASDG